MKTRLTVLTTRRFAMGAALTGLTCGLLAAQDMGGGSTASFKRPENPPVHHRPIPSEAAGGRLGDEAGPKIGKPGGQAGTSGKAGAIGKAPGSDSSDARPAATPGRAGIKGIGIGGIRSGTGAKPTPQPTPGPEPPPPPTASQTPVPVSLEGVEEAIEQGNNARDQKPPDYEEAERAYKAAAKLAPNDERPFIGLGNIYYDQKRDEEAIAAYRKALELQPKNRSVFEALGDAYFRLGKYEESIAATTELGLHTPNPGPFWTLTWASLVNGKSEDAGHFANGFIARWKPFMQGDTPYFIVFAGYLGYREAGLKDKADELLRAPGASSECLNDKWHCRLLKYLRHEVTAQQLLAEAGTNDKLTEARTYVGIDLALSGYREEALPHFRWVLENGNHDFVEYHLAKAWIAKLQTP